MSSSLLRVKSDLEYALERLRHTKTQISPIFAKTLKKLERTENKILEELKKVS